MQKLDNNFLVRILLFLNDERLMKSYLDEIKPGMRVWQAAHVYGDLVKRAAQRVGPQGAFHLTDVTPIQVEHGLRKVGDMEWAKVVLTDAADWRGERGQTYDVICSFFLLHEVPEDKKYAIVDNIMAQLPVGGKAVFVDYHGPAAWQPVRYILTLVNTYLEPFANALWRNEIRSYAKNAEAFDWTKRTFFGGVYQCVTAVHKQQQPAAAASTSPKHQ